MVSSKTSLGSASSRRPFNRREFLRAAQSTAAYALLAPGPLKAAPFRRPNIVFILSDDVGFGDIGSYGGVGVATPNLDKLARGGQRFTDAHSDAATCTPSRYAILTGSYAWRQKDVHILPGDAKLLIDPSQPTMPSEVKKAGYVTGCVGKWHVGLGAGKIEWNGEIKPGPMEVGFDYSFIIPATPDRVPTVYVENHRVVGLDPNDPITVSYGKKVGTDPTGRENPDQLKMKLSHTHDGTIVDGVSRIGFMSGGKIARWVDEDMEQTITAKAVSFIQEHHNKPFFLYFANNDIHVPHVPNKEFVGTSRCGLRCDSINQLDWSVGQIVATLERLRILDNTLIVFTSDNGPVLDDGYADGSVEQVDGHKPAGDFRGGKYKIYEGGTRVPFITYWPGTIKPGVNDALISQVDLMTSFTTLAGGKAAASGTGGDGVDLASVLLGRSHRGRGSLVEEADVLAVRKGSWKLIDRTPLPEEGSSVSAARSPQCELYDLSSDVREEKDLAALRPDKVKELWALLKQIRAQGHR